MASAGHAAWSEGGDNRAGCGGDAAADGGDRSGNCRLLPSSAYRTFLSPSSHPLELPQSVSRCRPFPQLHYLSKRIRLWRQVNESVGSGCGGAATVTAAAATHAATRGGPSSSRSRAALIAAAVIVTTRHCCRPLLLLMQHGRPPVRGAKRQLTAARAACAFQDLSTSRRCWRGGTCCGTIRTGS